MKCKSEYNINIINLSFDNLLDKISSIFIICRVKWQFHIICHVKCQYSIMDNKEDQLEVLGVVEDENPSGIGRRIEWMTKRQTLATIILFALCNVTLILFLIFAPPIFVTQTKDFQSRVDSSASNRFHLKFQGMKYFNSFLTLDIVFNQTDYYAEQLNYSIKLKSSQNLHLKKQIVDIITTPEKTVNVSFPPKSNYSEKIRLIAKGVINFDTLDYILTMQQPPGSNLPGFFTWHFADPSYSILSLFIRLVFFVIALIMFFRLLVSDVKYEKANISTKFVFQLVLLLIFACDPFYILAYFTQTPFFTLYDIIICLFNLTYTAYVALVSISMRNLAYKDYSRLWLILHYIPFLGAFCFFTFIAAYNVWQINNDPLSKITPVMRGIGIVKFALAALFLVSIVIHIFLFKTDIANEKPAYSLLSLIFFITVLFSEIYGALNPYLETDAASQTFTLIACALYTFFFSFINWPVEGVDVKNQDTEMNIEQGASIVNE